MELGPRREADSGPFACLPVVVSGCNSANYAKRIALSSENAVDAVVVTAVDASMGGRRYFTRVLPTVAYISRPFFPDYWFRWETVQCARDSGTTKIEWCRQRARGRRTTKVIAVGGVNLHV